MRRRFGIGLLAVALLVLLRISIGWHFLYEGLWKHNRAEFSSAGFWQQSKGPLADVFLGLVPDRLGYERLDNKAIVARWTAYRDAAEQHYNLGDEQKAAAEKLLLSCQARHQELLDANDEALAAYFHDLKRLDAARADPRLREVPFQQKRIWQEQQRLNAAAGPWLAQVDAIETDLRSGIEGMAEQHPDQKQRGPVPEQRTTLEWIDRMVVPFTIVVGFCLIVGLFTRTAAFCGAMFLLTIVLSQPELPTIYPPAPPSSGHSLLVNKEFIEMVALLALSTTAVGRWGGLDFFLYHLLIRPWTGRRSRDESDA